MSGNEAVQTHRGLATGHVMPESVRRLWGMPAQNDLPPSWDGVPVTWHRWTKMETSLSFHLPLDQIACDKCGSLATRLHNSGSRPPTQPRENWDVQYRDLFASRCPDCGRDSVWDAVADLHWDLDPEDYGDEGSTEPKDTLF